MAEPPSKDRDNIPWSDVVRFIRQLAHDLRNSLNAAELQAAYLAEVAESAELKEEVKRLREMIAQVSLNLKDVTSKVASINPTRIRYPATDFIEDLKRKLNSSGISEAEIVWDVQLEGALLDIDPPLVQEAFLELFNNAARHAVGAGSPATTAKIANDEFEFTLREPKEKFEAKMENWGREPMRSSGRGHYGLGLNRVHMIIEAHGGRFSAQYDSTASALLSRIVLPLAKPISA
jgi:K+-sensing histidine kinase KdpD